MNCKPGETAFIVRVNDAAQNWMVGMVVTVKSLLPYEPAFVRHAPMWVLAESLDDPTKPGYCWDALYDDILRPIRPNGVTDTEVSELYAPSVVMPAETTGACR